MSLILDKLIEDKKVLTDRLSELKEEIRIEELKIIKKRYGVTVGDIVKGRDGKDYKITQVKQFLCGKPWLKGNPRKNNGDFGKAERNLYNGWDLQQI